MSGQSIPLIYNPDLVSRDALVRSFVVREALLDEILEGLRRHGDTRQHHLVIGQRGMGKSTLLHRVAYAIDDDPALATRWTPLLFPEEQYNLRRLSDLFSNTVDALAERLERLGRDRDAHVLDDAVQAAPPNEDARQEHLLRILRDHCSREQTRMVLLLDNLDVALERIGVRGEWGLRQRLTEESWMVLIGAGTSMHESTWEHGRAFYDFFSVHELQGLDLNETRALLTRLAEMHEAKGVLLALENAPAKVRALHRLTGGNPRTLSLLFNVLRRDALGDITQDLTGLLDLCTPLYKHRLESLAPAQQRVVDTLALHWAPMTAGELAEALSEHVNDVSSQLSRLVRDGVVETISLPDTARAGHQIAERFFNVWYLMRAGRRLRKRLEWLVRFLKEFYEVAELEALTRAEVQRTRETSSPESIQVLLACADALTDVDFQRVVKAEVFALTKSHEEQNGPGLTGELFDLDGVDHPLREVGARIEAVKRLRRAVAEVTTLPQGFSTDQLFETLLIIPEENREQILTALRHAPAQEHRQLSLIHGLAQTLRSNSTAQDFAHARNAIENGAMHSLLDINGAIEQYRHFQHDFTLTTSALFCAVNSRSIEDTLLFGRFIKSESWQLWSLWLGALGRTFDVYRSSPNIVVDHLKELSSFVALPQDDLLFAVSGLAADHPDAERARRITLSALDACVLLWGNRPNLLAARITMRAIQNASAMVDAEVRADLETIAQTLPELRECMMMIESSVGSLLYPWATTILLLSSLATCLRRSSEYSQMKQLMPLLQAVLSAGLGPQARAMLDRLDAVDRLRPLAAALDCIVQGQRDSLARLPAEVRGVTEELLTTLAPELPTTVSAKKTKRRPRH